MLEKILALLAKAERTDNEHEAEAFTAKAEEMMIKYGIEQAMLDAAGKAEGKKDAIIVRRFPLKSRPNIIVRMAWRTSLGLGNVKCLQSRGTNEFIYIGFESDVNTCVMMFESLMIQATRQCARFAREHSPVTAADKREFMFAFAEGAMEKLISTRRNVEQEVKDSTPGAELVLVDRGRLLDKYMESYGVGKAKRQHLRGGSYEANQAGRTAGRNASVNKNLGGGGKRAIG